MDRQTAGIGMMSAVAAAGGGGKPLRIGWAAGAFANHPRENTCFDPARNARRGCRIEQSVFDQLAQNRFFPRFSDARAVLDAMGGVHEHVHRLGAKRNQLDLAGLTDKIIPSRGDKCGMIADPDRVGIAGPRGVLPGAGNCNDETQAQRRGEEKMFHPVADVCTPGVTLAAISLLVIPLHFEFRALDFLRFPPGSAANTVRGAIGTLFRRSACDPACPGAMTCAKAASCPYARIFEPRARGIGPSGFEDHPRPFVIRAATLDGRRYQPGDGFGIDVNIFDPAASVFDHFRESFAMLAQDGLGPDRARVELTGARELPPVHVSLTPSALAVHRIRVRFLTPTELKTGGSTLREAHFDALFARARDRVSNLCRLYQGGLPQAPLPPAAIPDGRVVMTSCNIVQVERERRSSRTGQRHSLGGFTGEAVYEGELAAFLPYLEAAHWTGVGRLTVWGNGLIETGVIG